MGGFKLKKVQEKIWEIEECSNKNKYCSKYLLNSQFDKKKEIEAVINRIDFRYHKNFIIFGIKNIELLAEIYKSKTPFSTMIIIEICENNEETLYLECDKEKLLFLFDNATVNIAIGSGDSLIKQLGSVLGQTIKLYNLRNIEIISMPYAKSIYPNEMQTTVNIIFERLRTVVASFGNSVEDILLGTDNYLNNWKHAFRGIDYSHFEGIYKDKPAIIVGAGPSLDKNIHQLKMAKGKALILCVDAALDSLLNAGIVPDIVASIERTEITTKFYKREIIPKNIVYLGPNVIPGSILERFSRIIFTGRQGDALFCDFNSYLGFNNLEIGGNVSNILLAFAQYLGCNPIIFVGLDLAYTDGRTHATQVVDSLDEDSLNNVYKNKESVLYVKGQNGELLETFEFFMYAKNWIEMEISQQVIRKYINATEGGAQINGAENQKLAEVILNYCEGQELTAINERYDELCGYHYFNKIKTTKKAIRFFSDLEKYFNNISKVARNHYNNLNKRNEVSIIQIMEKKRFIMESELNKNSSGRFILQSIIISFHRDIHSFPMALSKEDENRMIMRSKEYYDTLNKVGKKVNETLKAYKNILDSYLTIFKSEEGDVNGDNN